MHFIPIGYRFYLITCFSIIFFSSAYAQKKSTKIPALYQRASTKNFNRIDSLKGQLTPLRSSYDVRFYDLDVEVDPKKEIIKGISSIDFTITQPTSKIQIDLYRGLSIEKIIWNNASLPFAREHSAVYIDFPSTLEQHSFHTIKVWYSGRPLDPNLDIPYYAAFVWDKDQDKEYYAQAICQGNGAHGWWPNKDHLSDEPDSVAIRITVPAGLNAISNGRLVKKVPLENNKMQYQWKTTYPINNYNVTLNIGNYIHLSDTYSGKAPLTLDYYVLPSDSLKAKKAFKIVKPMLKIYEALFGPYPFPKDGVKLIQTPHPMEHQSAIAIGNDFDQSLILHEMAHEWWGNSLSCTDMAEFWIHEAFTTYSVSLFLEKHYGVKSRDRSLDISRNEVMGKHPLLGKFGVNHVHYDLEDIYSKGQLMLHTLRNTINDDPLWFDILKGLQQKFKHQSITTPDIVHYINQKTNADYSVFFKEYLNYTRLPKLQLEVYEKEGKSVLKYRWSANEERFQMAVNLFLGATGTRIISPTADWKEMVLPSMDLADIQVDRNGFYIDVDYGEAILTRKSLRYTGKYFLKGKRSRKFELLEENGKFFIQEKKKWKAELYFKTTKTALVKTIYPLTSLQFISDENGSITKIMSNQGGETFEILKSETSKK